jgi:hypothetical protein
MGVNLITAHNYLVEHSRLGTGPQCPDLAGAIGAEKSAYQKPARYRLMESTTEKRVPLPAIRER